MTNEHRILLDVAMDYRLQVADLKNKRRDAYLVKARREAIARLHALGMSSVKIGQTLNRDHSTILHHLSFLGLR